MAERSIAVFSDVHGNLAALEAVLDDLARRPADEVLVGGDLVGRGPEGSAVVRRIRDLGLPSIGGNHEDYLLDFRRRRVPDDWWESPEWAAARWMADELDEEHLEYLENLPFTLERDGFVLLHGTPRTNRDGIGPWTGDDDLRAMQQEAGAAVLVCAHTHRPLVRETEHGQVVNVGSVGLPFNRDRRAQYAVLHQRGRWGWEAEMRQVPYDLDRVRDAYERTGFLEAGGATAELLLLEIEHASPMLVPFIEWAKVRGVEATSDALDEFFRFMPPGGRLRDFIRDLNALKKERAADDE